MKEIFFKDFTAGHKIDLGTIALTEQEIIDFALQFDPLDFHIDKEAAKKSYFKDLIASGPHLFNLFHKTEWIPRFGHTVICGLEVNHWKFIKAVYSGQKTSCSVTILSIVPNPEKKVAAVKWLYEFKDEKGEMVQSLDMLILHKTE